VEAAIGGRLVFETEFMLFWAFLPTGGKCPTENGHADLRVSTIAFAAPEQQCKKWSSVFGNPCQLLVGMQPCFGPVCSFSAAAALRNDPKNIKCYANH